MSVRISVITPSFNQGEFLEETLRSVLDQRGEIHEFFVVDGGSTDGSVEIIEKYAGEVDWWVSEADSGQCEAIHKGFKRATGDVLYWINSDDVLLPGAIRRVREVFERQREVGVVSGWGVPIDGEGRIIGLKRRPHDSPGWARWGYCRVVQPCTFFKRKLYERVGGLDHDLHCVLDTELWYKFFRDGAAWAGVDGYLAAYRLHGEAKGSTMGEEYKKERDLMKERYPELVGRKGRHTLGRVAYYVDQIMSGRPLATRRDRRLFVGKFLQDVQHVIAGGEPAGGG